MNFMFIRLTFLFTFYSCFLFCSFFNARDDFFCKIHRVTIAEFPGAYNASLVRYKEGFLMAFRTDSYKIPVAAPENLPHYTQMIGLVHLDESFCQISKPQLLPKLGNRAQDPRLVWVNETLYLLYTSPPPGAAHSCVGSGMYLTEVFEREERFQVSQPLPLKAPIRRNWEKNWVPFCYKGKLYVSYRLDPHVVLEVSLQNGGCARRSTSCVSLPWRYGTLRGGTPAVLIEDHYLTFFHSSRVEISSLSGGYQELRAYYVGALTFESKPPFHLKSISQSAFSHPNFFTSPKTPLTDSLVVFPCGLVVEGNRIVVSYGENDGCIKIMELDKEKLYKSLVTVDPKEGVW